MIEIVLKAVFPTLMAFAAAYDLTTMTIPNRLTAAVALAFLVVVGLGGLGAGDAAWHLAAGAVVLLATFGMFAAGWIGGGDAKLAAAIALWFGFADLTNYLVVASVLGGALTLGLLAARHWPLPDGLARLPWVARLHDRKTGIPYGIALALAALIVLPDADIMLRLQAG